MVTNNLALADYDLLRWIPLIPLLAAVFNLFWGRALGRKTAGALACAAVGASFVLAFYVFWQLPSNGVFRDLVYTWIDSGSFKVNLSFQVDALSAVMLLIVTGIGFLIHIYSLGYMEHDEGMVRFFVYLNLFIFFMLVLVIGDNLLTLFVGWEGVGLCSYLLIGFWYQDPNNAIAGNKAFIVNRIGDFGFLLGIFLLVTELGRQRPGQGRLPCAVDARDADGDGPPQRRAETIDALDDGSVSRAGAGRTCHGARRSRRRAR